MEQHAQLGIIGGTGLGDELLRSAGGQEIPMDTPFGQPSCPPIVANWEGVDVAFIARHGRGHTMNPSRVPYRANIWAMKQLGVKAILASGATGSLREDIEPGHLVICDQVIDKTFRRPGSFFDEGLAVHVEFAEPFCPALRSLLIETSQQLDTTVHDTGTYVCMEGPQFSTRAESLLHRQWGADLIGMTVMPEAKLAREAELCYALVALPTDYDCWRPHDTARGQDELLREIMGNLKMATQRAVSLFRMAVKRWTGGNEACRCGSSLRLAIWSDRGQIDPQVRKRFELLIGRYFE